MTHGITVTRCPDIPANMVLILDGPVIFVGPFTNLGPVPGWTRHTLGTHEARRDRRLYPR